MGNAELSHPVEILRGGPLPQQARKATEEATWQTLCFHTGPKTTPGCGRHNTLATHCCREAAGLRLAAGPRRAPPAAAGIQTSLGLGQ